MNPLVDPWPPLVADHNSILGMVFFHEGFEGAKVCTIYPARPLHLNSDLSSAQNKIHLQT